MFKSLFKTSNNDDIIKEDVKATAVTALLVEAALIDGNFDTNELNIIVSIIKNTFSMEDEKEIKKLIDDVKKDIEGHGDLITYTRTIKNNWKIEDRIKIIEMMWKVCLVDGEIEPYEDMLIRRVAGLIYVSDKDRNFAKKKVLGSQNI